MALTDITFSKSESTMARGAIGSVKDIIMRQSFLLPLITGGGGCGGLAVRVIGSSIIRTIKVGR